MGAAYDYCRAQPSTLAMGCWRADGSLFNANEALLHLLGCTREEIEIGQVRWPDITPKEYASLDIRALQQIRERGESIPFEKEYIRSDGLRIPVLVGGAAFGNGVADAGGFFAVDLRSRTRPHGTDQIGFTLQSFIAQDLPSVDKIRERLSRLTPREHEIAELLACGESCKQIARRLEIAPKTVDNHRTAILDQMGANNPTKLSHMIALVKK
jgi:DNA-binding CsgD family transcriptional regulator